MATLTKAPARPAITISETEAERLLGLAQRAESRNPEVAELLMGELERARVRRDDQMPANVVRMGSKVEFLDEANGSTRMVELVWPPEADIALGKISVLTPVGAGLIGLSEGQSIMWPDREGRKRPLRILRVIAPGD